MDGAPAEMRAHRAAEALPSARLPGDT